MAKLMSDLEVVARSIMAEITELHPHLKPELIETKGEWTAEFDTYENNVYEYMVICFFFEAIFIDGSSIGSSRRFGYEDPKAIDFILAGLKINGLI